MGRTLTIGELARRTGVPVKRLRFYSDEGLLPPTGRSRSGYRLYAEEQVLRIELIRTLREAGMALADIGRVLRRDTTLERALALRLEDVEAHIAGLERIACALRIAIRSGATEERLRRIAMVTRASNEERRRIVAAFYDKVVDGLPVDPTWTEGMIEATAPPLTEPLREEQLEAWIELEGLLADPTFLACKRVNAIDAWAPICHPDALVDALCVTMSSVGDARGRGVAPSSREAADIVERFTSTMARAAGDDDQAATRERLRTKFDPRGARYWELVAMMKNDPPPIYDDWRWLGEAMRRETRAA
ncbi:MAG TPA: MerR family transcriptional regulator [Minicystis sp.]|nr:MerR family transcriptional regulator [Minicystis sp.]